MKGVLFIHLRRYLESEHPDLRWNEILYECGINQLFATGWEYPDRAIDCIVRSSARRLNRSTGEIYYGFGKRSIYEFRKEYRRSFDEHPSSRSFFTRLNDIVRESILNTPDVQPPEFEVRENGESVDLTYRSPRKMLAYIRGIIDGLLEMYGESARVEIVDESDDSATFRITYT